MPRGLNAIAVLAFALSSAVAHGQDSLPYLGDATRPLAELPAGLRLTLRQSIRVDRTRMSSVYATGGHIVSDVIALGVAQSFCMLSPLSPLPASAVGTNLNGETIVVGAVTRSASYIYDRATDRRTPQITFFINNNVAAGGSALLQGIVCTANDSDPTLGVLQGAFGASLEITTTLPADLGTAIRNDVLNDAMAFTGWYMPVHSITAFADVDPGSCLGIALSNIAHHFRVDANHARFVELLRPLIDSIRTRGVEIAPRSCAADGSHLREVDEDSAASE